MKILILLFLSIITIGVYCSSQNHTTSNILNQLVAALDEICTTQPNKCGPKTISGLPITVNIGMDELNNHIKGTIYDIIPELRRLSIDEANAFFKNELFPVIKNIIEELGVNSFDKTIITDEDAEIIVNNIRDNLRNKDIIAELLNSNSEIETSPSLFSDNYIKKLYIYPDNKKSDNYIKKIINFVKDDTDNRFPENTGNTYYSNSDHLRDTSYINEPLDIINKNDLEKLIGLCKKDAICKSYFMNRNESSIHFSIFKSIINGVERYHLLINDPSLKITIAHPITMIKKDDNGNISYELDKNFAPKEVYFYKPLSIFDNNNNLNSHVTSLYNVFTSANADNNNIILNYSNKCDQIRGNLIFSQLSSAQKIQFNNINTLLKQDIFDKLKEYSDNNNYDLTVEQRLRLSNNIASKIIDLYKIKINSTPNQNVLFSNIEINDIIKEVLATEQTEYNRQNNIFDFNLIKKLLSRSQSLTDNEIVKLSNMLKNNVKSDVLSETEIDNFENDLHQHINSNPNTEFTFNGANVNIKTVLENISNRNGLVNIFNDINSLSFCSNDEDRRSMEAINKFFGRENFHINDPSRNGYIKDLSLALNIMTGTVFRDSSKIFTGKIYIPQSENINLGTYITNYKMEGYQYKNPDTNIAEIDKVNSNCVGKYILGQDDEKNKGVDILDHLINVISDDQKNTNLPNQLEILHNFLTFNNNDDGKKKLHDFKNENHWINDILQYNLVDIFINSFNNRKELTNVLNILNNGGKIKPNKIINNYVAQYDYIKYQYDNSNDPSVKDNYKYVLDNCLNKGFTLKEFRNKSNVLDNSYYDEFSNHIKDTLNALNDENRMKDKDVINNLKRIKTSLNKGISQSYNTLRKANDLLNYFDKGTKSSYTKQYQFIDNAIKSKNAINDALQMHFLKTDYVHPHIGFFNNIVNENTKPIFFNFRKITGNLVNRPLTDINHSKELYIKTVMFVVGNGIYEHIYAVNVPGTINGIGINAAHLYQLDNEFVLLAIVVAKTNDHKMCQRSGVVQKQKREDSNGPCIGIISISSDKNIDKKLIGLLKLFKEKNIDKNNILPYYDNYDDISNPKYLHKNAEKITDVWKSLSQLFEKYNNKFNEDESTLFIMDFNDSINDYKVMLSKSEYASSLYLINFDEDDIKILELYLDKNYETHQKNFDVITDENGNDLIYKYDMHNEPESRNSRNRLIHDLNKLVSMVNQHNNNLMYGMGATYKDNKIYAEIDYRTIGVGNNLMESINNLCNEIESLNIDSLDDTYREELNNIYNDLHELVLTGNTEYNNGKLVPNLEIILKTHNTLASTIGKEEFNIDNISGSTNKISVPELEYLDGTNALDVIKNGDISSESKEFIMKGIESHIKNSENKYLDKDVYNLIINTNKHIEQQSKIIKEMQTHKGNQLFILNFVSLSSNLNDLVATAVCNNRIYSSDLNNNVPISPVEFDSVLDGRINYVVNINFNSALSSIAANNPNTYNSKAKFSKEASFYWNDSVTHLLSESSLINMFIDNSNIKSRLDVSSRLITDSNIESREILKFSFDLDYQYHNYQSPGSINTKKANDITHNYNKLNNKIIPKNIQSIEEYQSTTFSEALNEVINYNPDIASQVSENSVIKSEDVLKNAEKYDNNNKNSMNEDYKKQMEIAIKKFAVYTLGTYYKLAKMAGRENQVTFNTFITQFNSNMVHVSSYMSNGEKILGKSVLTISIKPNINNVNAIHNVGIANNNLNKPNKQYKLLYKKNTIKNTTSKKDLPKSN